MTDNGTIALCLVLGFVVLPIALRFVHALVEEYNHVKSVEEQRRFEREQCTCGSKWKWCPVHGKAR